MEIPKYRRTLLLAVVVLLLASGPATGQQDPGPSKPPDGRPMQGMEDCRSMQEMMGRLSTMMSASRAGDAAQMGESMDRMQRLMAEMREPMDRCMSMMSGMPGMGSAMGTQGGMGQGGAGMMGACCPPKMGKGVAETAAMVIGALAGLSLIAALLALTVFLLRRSRQPAAPTNTAGP